MDNVTSSAWLEKFSYFARVTTRDGRAIEDALAGATLFDSGARLDGAVIEATYAFDRPPLLKRLGDDRVPRMIDPQTLRFVGGNFLETESLARLPYAPHSRITTETFDAQEAKEMARDVLLYGQERGVDAYISAALPLTDRDLNVWRVHNERLLAAACSANGSADIDRKPLIAQIAPGNRALTEPDKTVSMLMDYPIDAVYVQALRLNPISDSLEKLARFVQFLEALKEAQFNVIVGRVGAFGLLLQALGVNAFDSGLGLAERHDLASLNRPLTDTGKARHAAGESGAPGRRIYLTQLMTTLRAVAVEQLLHDETLRHHFSCSLGCCRFRALEELGSRARIHYLYVRRSEVDALASVPLASMRLARLETQLREASDLGDRLHRALPDAGLPSFAHLQRWIGLLGREQHAAQAA